MTTPLAAATKPPLYYPRCVVHLNVLLQDAANPLGIPILLESIPYNAEVRRNSARKADECTVELDYRDVPFDPRMIKYMVMSVYLGKVQAANDPLIPTRLPGFDNLAFIGVVDEPRTSLGNAGQRVTLTARDFTGAWLDFRWPGYELVEGQAFPLLPTPSGTTLGALVLLMNSRVTPNVPVVFTDPLAAAQDVSLRTGKTIFASEKDDTAWDVLCALCDLYGLLPVFERDVLTIRTPVEPSITQAVIMQYGANIERLEFRRSLRQDKSKQVHFVCWNPVLGQVFSATWPPNELHPDFSYVSRLTDGKTTAPTIHTQMVQYNIEGQYTEPDLIPMAQQLWTEMAQGEIQAELVTREMVDLYGGPLTGLANGDKLFCHLGIEDLASVASMSTAEAIRFLSDPNRPNSLSPDAAAVVMLAWSQVQQLSVEFYVLEAIHKWDREQGYELTLRFRDFISVGAP